MFQRIKQKLDDRLGNKAINGNCFIAPSNLLLLLLVANFIMIASIVVETTLSARGLRQLQHHLVTNTRLLRGAYQCQRVRSEQLKRLEQRILILELKNANDQSDRLSE